MKTSEMRKLALMGVTAGLMAMNQSGLEAGLDANAIDLEYVLAKPSCKAHGGCGGLTASRDVSNAATQDDEELEDEDSADSDEYDDEGDDNIDDESHPE